MFSVQAASVFVAEHNLTPVPVVSYNVIAVLRV